MLDASIQSTVDIDAPIERVWSILLDLASYPEWNPFTPRIDATLRVGEPVVLHVAMKPGKKRIVQREICTIHDPSRWELGWGMRMGLDLVLRAHRVQRLAPLSKHSTRYFTEDRFSGCLVPLVMALYRKDIQRGFDAAALGLKARAEAWAMRA